MTNNNHKSNQKNPSSEAYKKMLDNRSRQLNPQDPKFSGKNKR